MDDREQQLVAARLDEAKALFDSARAHFARADQALALGGTLAAGVTGLALKDGFAEVLIGLPAALLLLGTYVLQLYANVAVLEAARGRIEDVLAAQLDEPPLIYQRWASRLRHGDYASSARLAGYVVPLIVVAVCIAGAIVTARFGWWAVLAYLVGTGLVGTTAVAASKDWKRCERDASKELEGWPRGTRPD